MLVKYDGKYFTVNPYRMSEAVGFGNTPDWWELKARHREVFRKHFKVVWDSDAGLFILKHKSGRYIGCWSRNSSFARDNINAAVNMVMAMGGK